MPISTNKKKIKNYVEEICSRSPRYAGTEGEIKSREYIVSAGEKLGVNIEIEIKDRIVLAETIGASPTYSLAQQYGASGIIILTDAPGNLCRVATATKNREAGQIPAVLVPVPVGRKLLTLMSTGRLKLRISLNGEFSKKTSSNIIITIPGTTIPDEQIDLNAHYDSDNLGEHAANNAAGCAALLELVRIFRNLKPKRTIKAIMFGVEEIGPFWGSFSYVGRHASELPNIKAVVTFGTLGNPYDFKFELLTTKETRAFALNVVTELG